MNDSRIGHRHVAPVALLVAALGLADIHARPDSASIWLGGIGTMAAIWLFVWWKVRKEPATATGRYQRSALIRSAVFGGCLLAVSLGLPLLRDTGIGAGWLPDRIYGISNGLLLVLVSNWIPKEPVPWNAQASSIARTVASRRFAGWAFTLAGLADVVVWTIAPLTLAETLANAIVATALILVIGRYVLWIVASRRA